MDASLSPRDRISQLLRHFGIERAHVAACMTGDWGDLVTTQSDIVASLTLVSPMRGIETPESLDTFPVLVISGDQGKPAERARKLAARIPDAKLLALRDYSSPIWADVIADREEEIGSAMLHFLMHVDRKRGLKAVTLPEEGGDIAGLTYRIRGNGPPLVLLPVALAPSQWEPLLPRLAARYCTITLGGSALGMVSHLEARGRSGYGHVVERLVDQARLSPGETILDVGCGSGFLDRLLARRTGGANPIVATDINRYLLAEAEALVKKERLEDVIMFREGNAEALPFPKASFDAALACTVLEEGDADRMLAELVRVTRAEGRVAIMTRAIDMDWWVNLNLPAELQPKINALGPATGAGVAEQGCADASLYRRMSQVGLVQLTMFPQFAIYSEGERLQAVLNRLLTPLPPNEVKTCREAIARADAEGTLFIAEPFHCAIGTKPSCK